VDCQEPA
jgi:hypothetical protein